MNQIGADTKIGKNLAKQFKSVNSDVEKLEQKLNQRISSETQIVRLKDQLDGVDSKIRDIGGTLQQVQFKDLDTTKFTASIQEMSTKLKELETQLSNNMGGSFNKIIQGWLGKSDNKFGNLLDRLKIDPKELNYENFSQVFTKAMEDARARAQDLKKEIEDLTKQREQYDRLASEAESRANFNPTDAVNQSLGKFANVNVKELSQDKIKEFQDNLAKFFQDINLEPDILEKKVQPLIDNLVNSTSGGEFQRKLAQFEGNLAKSLGMNKTNIDQLLQNTLNIDPKQFFNFDNFLDTSKINEFSTEVSNLLNNLMPDKSSDEISATYETVFKAFTNGSPAEAIKAVTTALQEYQKEQQAIATSNRSSSEAIGQTIKDLTSEQKQIPKDIQSGNGYLSVLQSNYNSLLQKYNELERQVEELRSQLRDAGKNAEGNIHTAGTNIQQGGQSGLAENIRLAKQYSQELESVKNAEQMVGKIEGITQRWFSVYAAVRMVTNAINSMKQTIAELDKTITEIAIVTDMSQSDLWGQMDSYTSMAREYAASISGVYKVSQLYYQQGLQTADVMALTESTLKMARISGLDYADATNYMTNAVRSFKMEMSEADKVVDVYSAIAAKSATDVSELAVAMSKTASSAEAVGSSFENTTAMMAVMIEATRESSQNIGSAMKSIISRYGELKENPSKLVDSEGEELSLNKVDTALQSVGISIHNAQGQFREFDDVIMELAEAWDTIDVNTQRYIATVMAGNRQQSRFLALVGSGERLKQLAADAADAENASQLQFLKTLDSIGAKQQQLETSLQSLYTSSGLEQFYKWILDVGNAIVTQFNDIPKLFNLPIPAILSFATTFYSLADVVTNVFGIIMNRMAVHRQQLEASLSNSANTQVQIEVNKNNQTLAALKEGNTKQEQEQVRHENAMEKIKATHGRITTWANGRPSDFVPGGENKQYGNVKTVNTASLGLNLVSLGLGAAATSLKGSSNEGIQRAGGITGALSRGANGAALGLTLSGGNPIGAGVGAAIGIIIGAFENLNAILPSTKVQIENLTKAATEANNKLLQEQAESKSLQAAIDKLKELEKARYDSVEAEQQYLEANNALATKYPELINSYAETGEAIINLDSATNLLTASLEQVVKATEDASTANVKLALKRYEEEQDEIDQLKDVRDSDSAGKAAGIINAIIASKDKDISNSFDSGALRQLGMVDSFSFAEAISQGKDLNSSEISKSFSSYIKNYLENNLQELASQKSKISVQVLSPIEKFIYDYIDSQVNQISSIDSREVANNKKLQTTIKGNILNDINSYLNLIRQAEDSNPFEGMDEASAIIKNYIGQSFNIDEIDTIEEWNEAQGSAQKATQEYYDTLVNWYSSIDKETYKNIMSFKGQVSSSTLINMLKASFGKIPEEILKGFSETYKDEFDRTKYLQAVGKIDNRGIKDALFRINQQTFNQLSDAERHAILDYGKQIESLIANGQITQNQGLENLNKYMAIWSELRVADIAPEQREAAEGLLRAWDGTREGLEGIITSLDGIGSANSIINAVRDLISSIPQNLNTIFSQISSSVASEIKTMNDAIKDLSSGVDMEKAVEYANKLGLSLKDFQLDYSTGLFTLNDTQKIIQKQVDNVNKQIGNAQKELDKYLNATNDKQENLNNIDRDSLKAYSQITDLSNDNDNTVKAFKAVAGQFNLEPGKLLPLIQEFFKQSNEVIEGGFLEWLKTKFDSDIESLTDISKNAQARGALQLGDLNGFLKQMGVKEGDYDKVIQSLLSNNGFDYNDIKNITDENVANEMQKYATAISEALGDITKNAVDAAISSITNGKVENIQVNQANEDILKKLGATGMDSGFATLDWSDTDINNYQARVNQILTSGLSPKDMDSALSNLESAVYNIDISEAINSVINSYEGFGIETANKFAQALGGNLQNFVDSGIFNFDKVTGKYSADLQTIRTYAATAVGLTDEQRNAALASIDKELRDTSGISVFNNIAKDYNNLTEDAIEKLANTLGLSYEYIKTQILTSNDDGTYKIDLANLQQLQQDLHAAADNNAKETIASIIDEYISQLTNISQIQSSGYTSLADMQKVADELGTATDSIFEWDNNLKAYVLSTAGIGLQAKHSKEELSKINDPTQRAQAIKLIESNAQTLAGAIDYKTLISSLSDGTFEKQANIFAKSISDYNVFIHTFGNKGFLNSAELIDKLSQGGMKALEAAWTIAKRAGEDLTGEDVESIYRSGAERIQTALSQMNLSIGSVIDETSVELLGIGDNVTSLGGGKAVITSAVNLVEAHKKLYEKMKEDNTSTLEELNNLAAQLDMDAAQADLIDLLKGVNDLTYTTLAQIASEAGIEYNALKSQLENAGAIEPIGGGHLQLNDFDFFASLIGITKKGTDYYIEQLSAANDAFISSNSNRTDKVVSQLKTLSESSAGQDVNIAYLSNQINDGIAQKLEDLGAIYHDGILSLGPDAKIGAITSLLGNLAQDIEGITEQDMAEIADAIDAFLKGITDSIKNGLDGKLSNSGKVNLMQSLKDYNVELSEVDFTKTAEGWQLSQDAAFGVVEAMRQMDALQGNIALTALQDSLEKAKFGLTDLYDYTNSLGYKTKSGNVDLVKHAQHEISGKQMQKAGYSEFSEDDYATLYSKTFTSNEFQKDIPILLNITPITNDGKTILSEADLTSYVEELFSKGNSAEEILELDKKSKGLLLGAEDVKSFSAMPKAISEATTEMNALHAQSDALAGRFKEISEINLLKATQENQSLDFMNNKLPEALENPLTYAENWGKAINILQKQSSGTKKGFIDARDWYNIVNEMNHIAGIGKNIEMYGVELDGSLEAASKLIQKGYNALESIDGGKLQVNLSELGVGFEAGAMDMKGSVTEGIHAMAKSQMEMLDGLISVLETVVAMQEAFEGLKMSEDHQLDFGELFVFGTDKENFEGYLGKDKFKEAANSLLEQAKSSNDLKKALEQVKINGESIKSLYTYVADGYALSAEKAQALSTATNALYKASLSGNYDLDNIYESVKEVLQQSGVTNGSLTIDIGTTTIYLTGNVVTAIDWDSDKVKKAMDEAYGNHRKKAQDQAKAAMAKWQKTPLQVTGDDLTFILESSPDVIIKQNADGTTVYEVDGKPYNTPEEAAKALLLKQSGVKSYNIDIGENGITGGKITGHQGEKITVKLTDEGTVFEYKGYTGNTAEEAIDAWLQATDADYSDLYSEDARTDYRNRIMEDKGFKKASTFRVPKNYQPNQNDLEKVQQLFANGGSGQNGEITGKDINDLNIGITTTVNGPLTIDQLKEFAEKAGTEYKPVAMQVAIAMTEGTPEPLATLITTGTATANLEITPTIVGSTTSGGGTENGLQLGEQLINAPIRINPTDVQLNGNTFLYDKALTVYAAISNLKLLPGEGGTTAVEGGTGNPLSEQAKAQLQQIVDTIWSDESINTVKALQATAYLGEILFATNEATVNTPPKIVVPQDWIGEKSLLKVDKILTFLYDLEYKPTEAAKTATIQVDTPGPLETIDIEQPYRIVFVPEGEGGNNEPQQPAGLSMGAEQIQGGIIAGNSDYSDYLTSMSQYLQKGGTLSQAGANSISQIANATRDNAGTQEFYEQFFGENGLFNIDDNGNISAMTTQLQDMGEALSDGDLISNMQNLSTLVLQVNSTDSNGLAALWTVLTELKDAAATFMQGPWKDVTSVLNDLSSLNIEAKTLTIDTVLTGEKWALELLKDLSGSTMNLNLNLGGTTTTPTPTPTPGLPGQNPNMTPFPQTGGMQGTYAAAYAGVGVGVGGQYGATPYGNMASATPATSPTQEQPELDTDKMEEGIEETNEQINAMAEASAKVAEGAGEFASQTEAVAGAMEEADSTIITLQAGVSTFATNAGTGAANAEAAA